jgi:S-formylglutathione hydrolase FrmB
MKQYLLLLFAILTLFVPTISAAQPKISITIPQTLENGPLNGRLLLLFSTNKTQEPRFQIEDGPGTQQVFGMDVENWQPGTPVSFDPQAYGYPIQQLKSFPKGQYQVQVVFHKYEVFNRSDGHKVLLPMDRGEGQHWNLAPGNLLSTPSTLIFDPNSKQALAITINSKIPPIKTPEDTKYIKHIRIQSKLLTAFWGRPMYLGANILLPEGWDTHPNVHYPLAIYHGHFPDDFGGFRTTPPDPDLKPDFNARFNISGYNKLQQQEAYDFYKLWTGPGFPRVIAIEIQHPTPFYDDSYAVNSANNGPYGDAIVKELIPEIEKQFRGIGQGWARFMYGGSTGGWEALAAQVFYPEAFNGCYAACPDPIDFRAFTTVNIYQDKNAYYKEGPFRKTLRPGHRNYLGHVDATVQDMNYRELALGSNGRSGEQWDVWESVFSPTDKNGYPKRIWNKHTGEIDPTVAAYWKENYDLTHIIQRDWPKIGQQLEGKIHLYCGDMDNFYLNNAVYLAENMLKELTNPKAANEVDYGDRAEHCWNGDHDNPNYISRLRYHRMFIPKWTEEMKKRVPPGADTTSWKY